MIRVKSSLLAESVVENPSTGQLSAIGIVDAIEAQSFPVEIPRLAFLLVLERDASDPRRTRADFAIEQGDREIARQTIAVEFGDSLVARLHLRLNGFAVLAPGPIRFRLTPSGESPTDYVITASAQPASQAGPKGAG